MFIRTKKSPRNTYKAVQLVESYREDGRMRQRLVRHVGTAKSDKELSELKQVAESIKAELELLSESTRRAAISKECAHHIGSTSAIDKRETLALYHANERARIVLGIHDVYGYLYDAIGFTNLLTRPKQREKAAKILKEIVLARIANPTSKRASVNLLEQQFGVKVNLDNVYQTMDKLDDLFYERVQKKALKTALQLTGEKIKVLFYDATTLYFESFTEDELKQFGYSKDRKFNQGQILLTLFVTEKGLPIGYEIFPGATFEGHTLIPTLEKIKERYNVEEVIFVADRGMLGKENVAYLEKNKFNYVVGSRIRSVKNILKNEIIEWAKTIDKNDEKKECTYRIALNDKQNIVLSYKASRARKDKTDREKSIQKLQTRLKRSNNPKQLLSNFGYQKFIAVDGESELKIDEKKLQAETIWDGIIGIETNHPTFTDQEILTQYKGLWQVEESFRITKHDLKVRPIYHWTPQRIRAHMAISFMAFTCVRYLEYRVATQYEKLSPEKLRQSLLQSQASIIEDTKSKKTYLLPSSVDNTTRQVYRVAGVKLPTSVMRLTNIQL